MMKTTLKVFVLLAALSLPGGASGVAGGPADTTLRDIARYREWTRVTEKPLPVENPSIGG
jgi:hypothetical protein